MLFNSTLYLVFLIVVVCLYYQLTPHYRRLLILLASYTFYWVYNVPLSALLLGSTLVDYYAARMMAASKTRRQRVAALLFSIVFNLGVLALFKYANFFADSTYALFGTRPWPWLDWGLPLGISFYTFQTMSYTIDVFRGDIRAKRSILDVALYVSFFPQLVAGPIVRAQTLVPQLRMKEKEIDWPQMRRGIGLVIWGLCKKVYVADVMGKLVNEVYGAPDQFGAWELVLATYAFAVQIYCDFSGYSDIAIGSALLLGIRLPKNFDAPYLACSIREFWRRWHISLSTWLRDYLYIPLGGSRKGRVRTYLNLLITMLLGGLWHGAGWNWVIWGGLHGGILAFERLIRLPDTPRSRITAAIRWFITLQLVMLTWVFFRARSMDEALFVLERIATGATGTISVGILPLLYLVLMLVAERTHTKRHFLDFCERHPAMAKWLAVVMFIVFALTFRGAANPEFIYFEF